MKRQRNYSQLREQEKTPEKINKWNRDNQFTRQQVQKLVRKMLPELSKRIDLNTDRGKKELETIKNT